MNPGPFVLAIDAGTESIRSGLFDSSGKPIAIASHPYQTFFPYPGWAEQSPLDWWDGLKKTVAECIQQANILPEAVKAIAIDATSSTVLPVDSTGKPLSNAILWMDGRASKEIELIRQTNHPVLKYSGGEDAVEWMVPKMLWLKKNHPEIYQKASKIVECLDWLNFKLTGEWVASICNATCKWNYVSRENGWPDDFFKLIGLGDFREKWPAKVVSLGEVLGVLTSDAANELGLIASIPVCQGGIDAHIGMLGMGVVSAGDLSLTIGSSSVHLGLMEEPVWSKGIWGPYPDAVIPGLWLAEGGQVSTGAITKWFREQLGYPEVQLSTQMGINAYQILADEASRVPPGSDGLIALDFWQGNRTPYRDPHARGVFVGLTLNHTRAHLYRAILESVAFGTRNILETMANAGCVFDKIIVGGGGSKNRLWLQIHADVCQRPLRTVAFQDSSLLGGAICAALGAGWYPSLVEASSSMTRVEGVVEPNPKVYEQYEYSYRKYVEIYHQLKEIMTDLSMSSAGGQR